MSFPIWRLGTWGWGSGGRGYTSRGTKTRLSQHLPRDKTRPSLHLPSKYEPNHPYVSWVTFKFWLISYHITLTPFEPSQWAKPYDISRVLKTKLSWHLPRDQIRPSWHLPRDQIRPSWHLPRDRIRPSWRLPSYFLFWLTSWVQYYLDPPPLSRANEPNIMTSPEYWKRNYLYISRVNMSQTILTSPELHLYSGSISSILPWPPLWADPMSQTILHLPSIQDHLDISRGTKSDHLDISRGSESDHLYISRVIFLFWITSSILPRPPLWSDPMSQTILHLPSIQDHTIFLSIRPRDLNPKMGVCVSPRGREPGGVLATGQALYYLGPWPRPPPAPSPVVAHTLPSLDWGLWGLTFWSSPSVDSIWKKNNMIIYSCVIIPWLLRLPTCDPT